MLLIGFVCKQTSIALQIFPPTLPTGQKSRQFLSECIQADGLAFVWKNLCNIKVKHFQYSFMQSFLNLLVVSFYNLFCSSLILTCNDFPQ